VNAYGDDNQIQIGWDWDQPDFDWSDNSSSRATVDLSINYVDATTINSSSRATVDLSINYVDATTINSSSRATVDLSINYVDATTIELGMLNSEPVAGFQMTMESDIAGFTVTGASGGRAGDAGFMMSTNTSGTVLGFSLTGATISEGDGVLLYVSIDSDGDDGCVDITDPVFSDASGSVTYKPPSRYRLNETSSGNTQQSLQPSSQDSS
jgi:hypothetical protein